MGATISRVFGAGVLIGCVLAGFRPTGFTMGCLLIYSSLRMSRKYTKMGFFLDRNYPHIDYARCTCG